MFESRENTTVSSAIFRPVVYISDIIDNTAMYDKCIKYVTNQPFLLFGGKERTNIAAP